MDVATSYWGIQGWEITTSLMSVSRVLKHSQFRQWTYKFTISFLPTTLQRLRVWEVFPLALMCGAGVDYIAIVGNIAYNTDAGRIQLL